MVDRTPDPIEDNSSEAYRNDIAQRCGKLRSADRRTEVGDLVAARVASVTPYDIGERSSCHRRLLVASARPKIRSSRKLIA